MKARHKMPETHLFTSGCFDEEGLIPQKNSSSVSVCATTPRKSRKRSGVISQPLNRTLDTSNNDIKISKSNTNICISYNICNSELSTINYWQFTRITHSFEIKHIKSQGKNYIKTLYTLFVSLCYNGASIKLIIRLYVQ